LYLLSVALLSLDNLNVMYDDRSMIAVEKVSLPDDSLMINSLLNY